MAQKQRSIDKFDGEFSTMLDFRRKNQDVRLTEILSMKRDGSILRTGKYLPPLPNEQNVSRIFLKSYEKQQDDIIYWWGKFLPNQRQSINKVIGAIMGEIQISDEKSKDLLRIFSVLASCCYNEGEEMQEYQKAESCLDYYSNSFEQTRKRLEIKRKGQSKGEQIRTEKKVEATLKEILQILDHNSNKMKDELAKQSHAIEAQKLEIKNLQKFLDTEKEKNIALREELEEKQEKLEKYKLTILNMKEVLEEQSKKKENELAIEILSLKEYIAKVELTNKKRKKRKRAEDSAPSSASTDSSSDSETEVKKRKASINEQENEENENLPDSPNKLSDDENATESLTEELEATEVDQVAVIEEPDEVV